MDPSEILRLVDTLHRDKDIDPEVVFEALEAAILSAARRKLGNSETVRIAIDRETGEIQAWDGDEKLHVDPSDLGKAGQVVVEAVHHLAHVLLQADRDDGLEADAEHRWIDVGVETPDDPRLHQTADSFETRRRGDLYTFRELLVGDPSILLQDREESEVDSVKFGVLSHERNYIRSLENVKNIVLCSCSGRNYNRKPCRPTTSVSGAVGRLAEPGEGP